MSEPVYSVFGSGEFLPWSVEVDRSALHRARDGDGSVLILPAASAPEGDDVFDNWARMGLEHYEGMGVPARVSGLKTREDARSEAHIAQIEGASMLYFSGGNPAYLADTLRDTPFWEAVTYAVDRGVALAGCSAGACIVGAIAPDTTEEEDIERALGTPGLHLLAGVIFGPHWNMLEHYRPGLQKMFIDKARKDHPECTLVAIDEDTAISGNGTDWQVYGKGQVGIIKDGVRAADYRAGSAFRL